tara:strand:- start:3070 stop:4176 length:1107 start_codon:yes stop_codon:yes gene_type:complete
MKIKFNNLFTQHKKINNLLIKAFKKNVKKSEFIGGDDVLKFENNFKKVNNSKYCISCANGSDALTIAIKTLGIKNNDEVITTCFSWIATSASITMAGGKVVFADIEKNSFNINFDEIVKKKTKKTVGIIVVHLYGYPIDMKKIMKFATQHKLWVIEDCAQAHLSQIEDKKVGNFGDIGTFSFFPSKNLGALGDAGCMVTNNFNYSKKARLLANHGGKGLHLLEGMNSRLDSLQASFLNIKLKNISMETNLRINYASIYAKQLENLKNIKLPTIFNYRKNVYHQFSIKTKFRDQLKIYLNNKGIETQIYYKKILPQLKPYAKKYNLKKEFPNGLNSSKEVLCLPISPSLKKNEIIYISNCIKNFLKKRK